MEILNRHPDPNGHTTSSSVNSNSSGGGSSSSNGGGGSSSANNPTHSSDGKNEPSPGYTLRATIDCERNEIYIFSVRIQTYYIVVDYIL